MSVKKKYMGTGTAHARLQATDPPPPSPPGSVRNTFPALDPDSMYRTTALLEAMLQFRSAPSYLKDIMFPQVITTIADQVWVDYWKGNGKLAPFVSRYAKGSTVPRDRFRSSLFQPPHVKPVRVLTADDVMNYIPRGLDGETSSEALLVARDIQDLDLQITRTEEWMCSQVLFTGQVNIYDWDTNRLLSTLDYGPLVKTVVGMPWTDPLAKPLDDLKACVRAVSSASNNMADVIVFGSNAATLFENNLTVQEAYNKLFLKVGELSPEQKAWGLTTLGTWRGLDLLIDETTYEAKDGTNQFYVPPDSVLVACSANQGRMAYAGVAQGDPEFQQLQVYEGSRIPLIWLPDNEDVRKIRLASRPCPVPPDPSNWTVMTVV